MIVEGSLQDGKIKNGAWGTKDKALLEGLAGKSHVREFGGRRTVKKDVLRNNYIGPRGDPKLTQKN